MPARALSAAAALVVGGGSAASSDAVQAVHADGTAAIVGRLPQVRSDDSVAATSDELYVIGGYDGVHELPGVLATTDGVTFRSVGQLGETVRYGAAYASSSAVWIFGGEHQGQPIADIQRVDIRTGVSTVVGKLPHPLAHAAVAVIGGRVLILGGSDGHNPQNTIFAFDPATGSVSLVGSMPESVSDMATAVVGDTAYVLGGNALTAEQTVAPTTAIVAVKVALVGAQASVQGSPAALFSGKLLIADRGNNRLTLVDPAGTIDWTFPNATAPAPPSGFFFPDDAFFTDHGTAILSNQEGNNTIVEISYPAGKPLWSYGHPGVAGAAAGYLHEPDDAYKLADGRVIVADANNLSRLDHQRTGEVDRPDRNHWQLHPQTTDLARISERRYATAERKRVDLRGNGLVDQRVHHVRRRCLDGPPAVDVPVGPTADRSGHLPGGRLHQARRTRRVRPRRAHLVGIPGPERARDA